MVKRFPAHLCCLNENGRFSFARSCPIYSFRYRGRSEPSPASSGRAVDRVINSFSCSASEKADRQAARLLLLHHFFQPLPHDILDGQILNIQSLERCGDLVSAVAEHAKRRRRIGELVSAVMPPAGGISARMSRKNCPPTAPPENLSFSSMITRCAIFFRYRGCRQRLLVAGHNSERGIPACSRRGSPAPPLRQRRKRR